MENKNKKGLNEYEMSCGDIDPIYGGIVTNVASLPDGTYFHVNNGCWRGYVASDNDGHKIIYTGVSKENDPTICHTRKIVLKDNEPYMLSISDVTCNGAEVEIKEDKVKNRIFVVIMICEEIDPLTMGYASTEEKAEEMIKALKNRIGFEHYEYDYYSAELDFLFIDDKEVNF